MLTLLVFLVAISSSHSDLIVLSGVAVSAYLLLTIWIWLSKSAVRSEVVIIVVSAGMVLMPTTIGAAAVFAAMPDMSLLTATVLGIPLFLFSLLCYAHYLSRRCVNLHTMPDRQ